MNINDYVVPMVKSLDFIFDNIYKSKDDSTLCFYGSGESAHWPVQSNMNVLAGLAVLGTYKELDKLNCKYSSQELIDTALSLFRYAMHTHVTGDSLATDGKQWGIHWISVLGAERMTHGVNALWSFLNDDDKKRYRNFRIAESNFLCYEYKVQANMLNHKGNKPESNIWNGSFLLRTAFDYPEIENANDYLNKATEFMLNGLSHPTDVASEVIYNGKPLREWHIGFNFTPNYSLDHHGYMNIGYSYICLSNLAMLYFNCKEKNQTLPPEFYLHIKDLWNVIKEFTFPDGRLLRIGGDTRSRYTYCQCYALPSWILMEELFGDAEATSFEEGYLKIIEQEQKHNSDGAFYSTRLLNIKETSYYYYSRLESDPFLVLSQAVYWKSKFNISTENSSPSPALSTYQWHDDFHNAYMIKTAQNVRSLVRANAQGLTALCHPLADSSLAEWQGNLSGNFYLNNIRTSSTGEVFDNGFAVFTNSTLSQTTPYGEGEAADYNIILKQSAVAAIPDGVSMLIAEKATMLKNYTLAKGFKSVNLLIPNDVYNNFKRNYNNKDVKGYPKNLETIETNQNALFIDNAISIFSLGKETFKIHQQSGQNIFIKNKPLSSLYADTISLDYQNSATRYLQDDIVYNISYVVCAQTDKNNSKHYSELEVAENIKHIIVRGYDNKDYLFIVNFSNQNYNYDSLKWVNCKSQKTAKQCTIKPESCALFVLGGN